MSSPVKRNPFNERNSGLRLHPFHVATYYLRSLSDAAKADPGSGKEQKYKFLSNYFKDLPPDLESLLQDIRNRVRTIEILAEDPESDRREMFRMCEEIRAVSRLPRSIYQMIASSDKHLPGQYDDGVTELINVLKGYLQSRVYSDSYLSSPSVGGTPFRESPGPTEPRVGSPEGNDRIPASSPPLSPNAALCAAQSGAHSPTTPSVSQEAEAWQSAVAAASAAHGSNWHHRGDNPIVSTKQWVQSSVTPTPRQWWASPETQSESGHAGNQPVRHAVSPEGLIPSASPKRSTSPEETTSSSPKRSSSPARSMVSSIRSILRPNSPSNSRWHHRGAERTVPREWHDSQSRSESQGCSNSVSSQVQSQSLVEGDERGSEVSSADTPLLHALEQLSALVETNQGARSWESVREQLPTSLPQAAVGLLVALSKILQRACDGEMPDAREQVLDCLDQLQDVPELPDFWSRSSKDKIEGEEHRLLELLANKPQRAVDQWPAPDNQSSHSGRSDAISSVSESRSPLKSPSRAPPAQFPLRVQEVRSGSISNSVASANSSPSWEDNGDTPTLTAEDCLMVARTSEAEVVVELILANNEGGLAAVLSQLEAEASCEVLDSVRACLLAMLHAVNLQVRALSATALRLIAEVDRERLLGWGEEHTGLAEVGELTVGDFGGSLKCVVAGDGFTHVLTDGGQVLAFGCGDRGQLGTGGRHDQWRPMVVPGPWVEMGQPVVGIDSGKGHTLACDIEGSLYIWGEFVLGSTITETIPQVVAGLDPVSIVSCGLDFCAAVTRDGSMYMWGDNSCGQLGTGDTEYREAPCLMIDKEGFAVTAVGCGDRHVLIGDSDGRVFSWGLGSDGQLGHGDRENKLWPHEIQVLDGVDVVHLSAGAAYSCAVSLDGYLMTWGDNRCGQLGHGDLEPRYHPTEVQSLVEDGVFARQISCGAHHMVLISTSGEMFAWGDGLNGQLDCAELDESKQLAVPYRVSLPENTPIAAARLAGCGEAHTCVLTGF